MRKQLDLYDLPNQPKNENGLAIDDILGTYINYLAANRLRSVQCQIDVLSLLVHVKLLLFVQGAEVDGVGNCHVDERAEYQSVVQALEEVHGILIQRHMASANGVLLQAVVYVMGEGHFFFVGVAVG